jgi:hypothetical protein
LVFAMSRVDTAPLESAHQPIWSPSFLALLRQAPQSPTPDILKRWPEALHYRVVSLPATGRLGRLLGWRETVMVIAMDDARPVIVVTGHFGWLPSWRPAGQGPTSSDFIAPVARNVRHRDA